MYYVQMVDPILLSHPPHKMLWHHCKFSENALWQHCTSLPLSLSMVAISFPLVTIVHHPLSSSMYTENKNNSRHIHKCDIAKHKLSNDASDTLEM
ncbi:hypothetical protein BLOT_014238 [Blomia tropicalis]|nr:hypothetical protein BLOT_014238 [Blomia tropicalis]